MLEKYTVVIPARNSLRTLRHTLQTCLSQAYENFEIIVSDNCSEDGTEDYIAKLNDERIVYYKTSRPLSMTDNFEFALSKAKSGYIMFIGSDDGLMPGAIEYVDDLIKKNGVQAVACQYAHYFWPDVPVHEHGRLTLSGLGICRSGVEIRNSGEWIRKTISFKTALYVCDLPCLYYGFVHRSVVDKAIKDGKYFRSIAPDGYSAFATATNVDRYVYSFRPFVIAGISNRSNGLSHTIGSDISRNFVAENTHPIHKNFSYCSAFEIIMGESYCQFADAFPDHVKGYELDFREMLRKSLTNTNEINRNSVHEAVTKMAALYNIPLRELQQKSIDKLIQFVRRTSKMGFELLKRGSKYVGIKNSEPSGVKNVYDASIVLGVLEMASHGNRIETVRSRFLGRVKMRLFLSRDKDVM